jgi:hypothetical protein
LVAKIRPFDQPSRARPEPRYLPVESERLSLRALPETSEAAPERGRVPDFPDVISELIVHTLKNMATFSMIGLDGLLSPLFDV